MSSPFFSDLQTQPVRTNEEFTSGIVNVPQNTPAKLYFICLNDAHIRRARLTFAKENITYDELPKRKKIIIESRAVLDNKTIQRIIEDNFDLRKEKLLKRKTEFRYVFFELDSLATDELNYVLQTYKAFELPVYYHRTMRGWHFLSVKPIEENSYHACMNLIKHLNTACPHITLRIRPNKWVGEMQIFKVGNIQMQALHSDTVRLKQWLELQDYYRLKKQYMIVNYRQTGELANL